VKPSEVREFHYIARYENIRSIMNVGILSHARAAPLKPVSFAMDTAQARRAVKEVVPGRTVHAYANVYFDAHNPTLSARREQNEDLAILRVAPDILGVPGTHIATQNAASVGVRFLPSPAGLAELDAERVYAVFWLDERPLAQAEWSLTKCAEVLVPDRIPPEMITGAYVCSVKAAERLARLAPDLPTTVHPPLYFW
jgi:hypothetical protein